MIRQFILSSLFLLYQYNLGAQDISGTWEGIMGDEKIQINIYQQNNKLCGYTYDFRLVDSTDHCKATFTGNYDSELGNWFLSGGYFLENSGNHVLMRIRLWPDKSKGPNFLRGRVYIKSVFSYMLGSGASVESFILRKKNSDIAGLKKVMPECFPKPPAPKPTVKPPKSPTKPSPPPVAKKKAPVTPSIQNKKAPLDTTMKRNAVIAKSGVEKPDQYKSMVLRKKSEISHVVVNTKFLNLKVYDNGIVDNDTVTIFYNNRVLISKKLLSEQPLELNIELDDKVSTHEIILFAENLGSIPPNTALIIVTAGDKRFELHSSASLEENAVLIFDYKPK